MELPLHHDEEGEERHRDAERGGKDGFQEVDGGVDGGLPTGLALSHHLHVRVDNDYRVVHYHSQSDDEGGQCHGVQLDPEDVEHTQRDEYGNRHRAGGDHGHTHRHDEDDHKDDRRDGYQQLMEEVLYRVIQTQ